MKKAGDFNILLSATRFNIVYISDKSAFTNWYIYVQLITDIAAIKKYKSRFSSF